MEQPVGFLPVLYENRIRILNGGFCIEWDVSRDGDGYFAFAGRSWDGDWVRGAIDIYILFPYTFLAAKKGCIAPQKTKKGVFIMTLQGINKRFTEIVSDYIQKGYYLNTSTMAGSQGEEAKIDLTNGKEIIRVLSKIFHEEFDNWMDLAGIKILVGQAPGSIMPNNSRGGTIWNDDLEILLEEKFYKIGSNRSSGAFYGAMEESAAAHDLHSVRCCQKEVKNIIPLPDTAKPIALRWVRKQPRWENTKLRDISKVYISYRAGMKEYWIIVKDKGFCIHKRSLYKKGG